MDFNKKTATNTGFAKVAVQCSASTFVVKFPTSPSRNPLGANYIVLKKVDRNHKQQL
jgi:hypothetical protein